MFGRKSILSKLILSIFAILMILLLGFASFGSKQNYAANTSKGSTSPAPPSQNAKPDSSTAAKARVITYESYLKIKLDTTYDDVRSILGEGEKKVINADVVNYLWNEQGNIISIQTIKGKVKTKIQSKLGKTASNLTVDQFNKVTTGMTIDQVVSILGPAYQEVNSTKSADAIIRLVAWIMPDSTYVLVQLRDDKVTNKKSTLK